MATNSAALFNASAKNQARMANASSVTMHGSEWHKTGEPCRFCDADRKDLYVWSGVCSQGLPVLGWSIATHEDEVRLKNNRGADKYNTGVEVKIVMRIEQDVLEGIVGQTAKLERKPNLSFWLGADT